MAVTSNILRAAGKVSVFGFLENIPAWRDLPYTVKGTLLRAAKAGLSAAVGIVLAAGLAGTLFPADWGPVVAIAIIPSLQAIDKYIREWNIEQELEEADAKIAVVPEETPEVAVGDSVATETEGEGKVEAPVTTEVTPETDDTV